MTLDFKKLRKMDKEDVARLKFDMKCRGCDEEARYIGDFQKYGDKLVEVVKGRKVPIGTRGVLFWLKYYEGRCSGSYASCGIRKATGEVVFTSLANVVLAHGTRLYAE